MCIQGAILAGDAGFVGPAATNPAFQAAVMQLSAACNAVDLVRVAGTCFAWQSSWKGYSCLACFGRQYRRAWNRRFASGEVVVAVGVIADVMSVAEDCIEDCGATNSVTAAVGEVVAPSHETIGDSHKVSPDPPHSHCKVTRMRVEAYPDACRLVFPSVTGRGGLVDVVDESKSLVDSSSVKTDGASLAAGLD